MAIWGATISGAGHAAVIGLAVWALPWMRAGPDPGVAVMTVRLVDPSQLVRAAPPPPDPPDPKPQPAPPAALPAEATVPHPEVPPEEPPVQNLAGRFDPDAPLGFRRPAEEGVPEPSQPPAVADPSFVREEPDPDVARQVEFKAAVSAAVEAAKVYPETARRRGLFGTTRVALLVGPEGEVAELRIVQPSGAKALDDAALAAVRNARLPAPPRGEAVACDLGISFTLRDK